ncbi:MAG: hypothetical protein MPJ50_05095 [Pirellulales bacterium]|nr:hypothetical protein [Pirellulales bacterium]
MLAILIELLPFAQKQPTRLWDKMAPTTRAQLLMALVGFLILMAGLYIMIRLGGRWARRTGAHEQKDRASSTSSSGHSISHQPRPFLKPLNDEEARLAVPLPNSYSVDSNERAIDSPLHKANGADDASRESDSNESDE